MQPVTGGDCVVSASFPVPRTALARHGVNRFIVRTRGQGPNGTVRDEAGQARSKPGAWASSAIAARCELGAETASTSLPDKR